MIIKEKRTIDLNAPEEYVIWEWRTYIVDTDAYAGTEVPQVMPWGCLEDHLDSGVAMSCAALGLRFDLSHEALEWLGADR